MISTAVLPRIERAGPIQRRAQTRAKWSVLDYPGLLGDMCAALLYCIFVWDLGSHFSDAGCSHTLLIMIDGTDKRLKRILSESSCAALRLAIRIFHVLYSTLRNFIRTDDPPLSNDANQTATNQTLLPTLVPLMPTVWTRGWIW